MAGFTESHASGPPQPPPASRGERRRDPRAPEWERARPLEAFPTLRARRLPELSVPPILVSIIALALAAAVLFALPGLLGFGNPGGAVATPSQRRVELVAAGQPPADARPRADAADLHRQGGRHDVEDREASTTSRSTS